MPDPTTIERLRGLILSAADLHAVGIFPDWFIEDYLNIFDNFITFAELIDDDIDLLTATIQYIESIKAQTDKNRVSINKDFREIQKSGQNIEGLDSKINKNKTLINGLDKGLNNTNQYAESINTKTNKTKASLLLYFLLGGRPGGQVGYGGTVTGDDLTLYSNTLKDGTINLGDTLYVDEATDKIGIRTTTLSAVLNVRATGGDEVMFLTSTAGIQATFNKANVANSAVFRFQTGEVTDWQFGTIANDDIAWKQRNGRKVMTLVQEAPSDALYIDGSGNVGFNTSTVGAKSHIVSSSSTTIGQIIQGYAAQIAPLTEWQDSAANVLAHIDKEGSIGGKNRAKQYFFAGF